MTDFKNTVLFIVCIISICINAYLFYRIDANSTSTKYEKIRTDSLNNQILLIESQLRAADTLLTTYQDSLYTQIKLVNLRTSQLQTIKKSYEKIKPTDNASMHDVIEFFTNRYN